MKLHLRRSTVLPACFIGLAFAGSSAAQSTPAIDFTLGLGADRPASATGLTLHEVFKDPSDPSAKPSPLRKSVLEAPPGTVFDGHAIPVCTATDNDLITTGPSACAPGSQVGTGTVLLITGLGAPVDPLTIDAVLFNSGQGITELFSDHASGARLAVGHATFTSPNTLTETPAPNPGGPPDGESAVRQVDFHFQQLVGATGRAFITTPTACPAGGAWTSRLTATFANGHTYSATSATPCSRPVTPRKPPHHRTRCRHRRHRHCPR